MSRRLYGLGVFAAIACATSLARGTVSASQSPSPAAPADVYFGVQKMSPIGIRERIDKLGRSYHNRWSSDDDLVHDAGIVSQSLDAWQARYPRDPWMAPTYFHLEQLYFEIQTPAARARAIALANEVARRYGKTRFGHLARLRIAQGFPPLHAESPVMPTPGPYASASPAASDTPAGSPSPGGSPALGSPIPSGAPNASATPSAAPTAAGTPA